LTIPQALFLTVERREDRVYGGRCPAPGVLESARIYPKEEAMNDDTLKGQWKQMRGEVKKQWGKLTDDDLDRIDGERDKLAGKVQELYGHSRDEVHEQVDRFYDAHRDRRVES
jgi:uncharacterized protein YjbJ (UPF0337 family)